MSDNEEKGTKESPQHDLPVYSESGPAACGPGCNCGAPSGSNKMKVAVFLIVMLAIGGILIYKASNAKGNATNICAPAVGSEFSVAQTAPKAVPMAGPQSPSIVEQKTSEQVSAPEHKPKVTNDSASATKQAAPKAMVGTIDKPLEAKPEPAKDTLKFGENLETLSDLNRVAMRQDAVFIFIPTAKSDPIEEKTNTAVHAAQRTLKNSNISTGLYTLPTSSPNYAMITAQAQPPAILVAVKGKGIGAVSGEVTETKLLQTFMAASSAGGGCCPSGGGASSGCR